MSVAEDFAAYRKVVGEHIEKLERENAALKQRILDDNKAYGCELMDPSGTIWDHAKRLQQENAALKIGCAMLGIPLEDIEKASANSLAKRIAFRMEKETKP